MASAIPPWLLSPRTLPIGSRQLYSSLSSSTVVPMARSTCVRGGRRGGDLWRTRRATRSRSRELFSLAPDRGKSEGTNPFPERWQDRHWRSRSSHSRSCAIGLLGRGRLNLAPCVTGCGERREDSFMTRARVAIGLSALAIVFSWTTSDAPAPPKACSRSPADSGLFYPACSAK